MKVTRSQLKKLIKEELEEMIEGEGMAGDLEDSVRSSLTDDAAAWIESTPGAMEIFKQAAMDARMGGAANAPYDAYVRTVFQVAGAPYFR